MKTQFAWRCAFFVLSLFMTSCQTVKQEEISASMRGGDSTCTTVFELRGSKMTKFVLLYNATKKKVLSEKKLSPSELSSFWDSLEREGLYAWLPSYRSSGVNPGTGSGCWSITLRRNGKVFKSYGDDAFPSEKDPKKTSSFKLTDRFLRIGNIFETDPRERAVLPPTKKMPDIL
jgi:hypothetical protein